MGRVWRIALLMWLAFAMDAAMAEARVLAQVDVPSPSTLPIWELRRGDDRLVILSDFWPRRRSESVDFSPARLSRVAAEAEVFVSAPGVAVDDSVSVWRGIWLWRAYRQAVRNPDHGRLRDLLPPDAYTLGGRASAISRCRSWGRVLASMVCRVQAVRSGDETAGCWTGREPVRRIAGRAQVERSAPCGCAISNEGGPDAPVARCLRNRFG